MAAKIEVNIEGFEDPFFLTVDVDGFRDPMQAFDKMGLFKKSLSMKVRIESREIRVKTEPRM